jgi:hypothetical protein
MRHSAGLGAGSYFAGKRGLRREGHGNPAVLSGVFDVERFSLGYLLHLVGHEMQHGGQKSEAGGCK